jgi:hypothetical protein
LNGKRKKERKTERKKERKQERKNMYPKVNWLIYIGVNNMHHFRRGLHSNATSPRTALTVTN